MESWSQEYVTQARERVIKPAPTSKNVVTIFLMDLQMVPNPKFPSKFPHQHERLFHTRLVCSKDIFYFPIQQKDTPCTNTEQFRIGAAALHGIGPRWYGTQAGQNYFITESASCLGLNFFFSKRFQIYVYHF